MIKKQIALDIALETARHYGPVSDEFVTKMEKRIKRKFKTNIDPFVLLPLIQRYREVYSFGVSQLKNFLLPRKGKYASLENVDNKSFVSALERKFPDQDKAVVAEIVGRIIFWDYLR